MTFSVALMIDIAVLIPVTWFVIQVSGLNLYNPSLLWLVLHLYAVTLRLGALAAGYQVSRFAGILTDDEVIRAALADDIALVAVALAVALAAAKFSDRFKLSPPNVKLNPLIGKFLSVFCLIAGTFCLLAFGFGVTGNAASKIGNIATTSYPLWIAGFAAQGAVIQCALYGFTPLRIGLLLATTWITSIRMHRANALLPVLMAIIIYHLAKRKMWISIRWGFGLLALGLVFYAYKPFSYAIMVGEGYRSGLEAAQQYLMESKATGEGDNQLLDEQATYMAAADDLGKRFYGSTVLPLVYLPIPRYLWPDKPSIAQFAIDLTSNGRPIATTGMTALLTGESYINFGWLGCFAVPFLYMFAMMYGYYRVRYSDPASAQRWFYLVMFIALIQVYRDGLNSIVLFGFVVLFPMVAWSFLSVLAAAFARPNKSIRYASASHKNLQPRRL